MSYIYEWRRLFRFWRSDLVAGITVAFVALPLALGFAITTGAPAGSGILTAIVAGFIAALFGGSNYQVSGPTGAMTVVLVPIVTKYGVASLTMIGLVAGAIILALSALRLGNLIDKVPLPVMEGFTLGIALIIALQQIPLLFETAKAPGTNTLSVAFTTLHNALSNPIHWSAIFLALFTLVIKRSWAKVQVFLRIEVKIPGTIIAVFMATLVSSIAHLDVNRIGELPRNLGFSPHFTLHHLPLSALIYSAFVVAALGAIESLLSARVADSMAHKIIGHERDKHQPNKELLGQGLATIASACLGGLPATGAIARTGVNVNAGARTRLAAMFHAIFLVATVFLLAPIVSQIPTSVLAGVLVGTSLRIANPRSVREALTTTRVNKVTYMITAMAVLFIDLIWGTFIGIAVYLIANKAKDLGK